MRRNADRELVVVRLRPVPLGLDRDGRAAEQVAQLLLDLLGDPRRFDPVGDLGEEAELETVAGRVAGIGFERDVLADLVLGEPGRLDVVLVDDERLAAILSLPEADVEQPARAGIVRPRDLVHDAFGARRSGDTYDLSRTEAWLHRAQRSPG